MAVPRLPNKEIAYVIFDDNNWQWPPLLWPQNFANENVHIEIYVLNGHLI